MFKDTVHTPFVKSNIYQNQVWIRVWNTHICLIGMLNYACNICGGNTGFTPPTVGVTSKPPFQSLHLKSQYVSIPNPLIYIYFSVIDVPSYHNLRLE